MNNNIKSVVKDGKCCSCGICAGICPTQCISMSLDSKGRLFPIINETACKNCGLCISTCTGKQSIESIFNVGGGNIQSNLQVYNGYVNDKNLLQYATSGGICSVLIKNLLDLGKYNSAFVVDSHNMDKYLKTKRHDSFNTDLQGSRYVPVSHEDAVRYILKNRNEKIIFVGTGCAIRGFSQVISKLKLNRDNYLLLGLFCDKMMTYRVWDYFKSYDDRRLDKIYFRSKKGINWPGNVRLCYSDGERCLPKTERQRVKDFFCNERCLYCQDKLANYADISLGDNYTDEFKNIEGSNSIIIRSEIGIKAFKKVEKMCELQECSINKINVAQQIRKRAENTVFAGIRFSEHSNISIKLKIKYYYKKLKIYVGHSNCKILLHFLMKLDLK